MKQISIVVESKPGVLASITELMAAQNININNIEAVSMGETGVILLYVEEYDTALRILNDAGYRAISEESILINLKDEPGALAKIAKRFADAGIGIRGMHIIRRSGDTSIAAVSTKRTEEAIKLVEDIIVKQRS